LKLHSNTFEYLKPTDEQIEAMTYLRQAAREYATALEHYLPDGADKTMCLRNHRTTSMWANVAVTREADGTPRSVTH